MTAVTSAVRAGSNEGGGDVIDESDARAQRFAAERLRLVAIAHRLLGSRADAEDVVQDAWLRFARADEVANPAAWLTTVVTRLALNALRDRAGRREDELVETAEGRPGPDTEAELGEAVSHALLVVLAELDPAERVALVLHDVFAVPFDAIAPVLDRSGAATRQLASRGRRRVREADRRPGGAADRIVVDAFLAAARAGDLPALVRVLHPDVVLDTGHGVLTGSAAVAGHAHGFADPARLTQPIDVPGRAGVRVHLHGAWIADLVFTVVESRITAIDVTATG